MFGPIKLRKNQITNGWVILAEFKVYKKRDHVDIHVYGQTGYEFGLLYHDRLESLAKMILERSTAAMLP